MDCCRVVLHERRAYFYRTMSVALTNPPPVAAPSLSGALRLPGSRVCFQLNSTAGTGWQLQGSPNLWHWSNYGLLTNQTGTMAITNAPFGRPAGYCYRVVQP